MNRVLIVVAAVLTLSACASNKPYSCQLNGTGSCANMQEIYNAARKAPRNVHREHVFETHGNGTAAPMPMYHNGKAHMEPGDRGQPVFKQPRVYRVWLAPYVDADGNLRSGEYAYFSTPGEWAYGTTRESGVASGATFGPSRPGDLGFNPVEVPSKTSAPPKPNAPTPASTTRDGITQPMQTLTP